MQTAQEKHSIEWCKSWLMISLTPMWTVKSDYFIFFLYYSFSSWFLVRFFFMRCVTVVCSSTTYHLMGNTFSRRYPAAKFNKMPQWIHDFLLSTYKSKYCMFLCLFHSFALCLHTVKMKSVFMAPKCKWRLHKQKINNATDWIVKPVVFNFSQWISLRFIIYAFLLHISFFWIQYQKQNNNICIWGERSFLHKMSFYDRMK